MLSSSISSETPHYPYGLSQQTILENEKLALSPQPSNGRSSNPSSPLKDNVVRHHEHVCRELDQLQDMLREALLDNKVQPQLKLNMSINRTADKSRSLRPPTAPTPTRVYNAFATRDGKKTKILAKKSVRMIAMDLETKLNFYRTNPAHYEIFKTQTQERKAEKKTSHRSNLVLHNIENVKNFEPSIQKKIRIKKAMINEEHFSEVKKARESILQRLKEKQSYYTEQTEKKEFQGPTHYTNDMQSKWLMFASLASRMYYFSELLKQSHEQFFFEKRHNWAAKKIQRAWRTFIYRKTELEKKRALIVISRAVKGYMVRKREMKRHLAANIVRDLFKEMNGVSKLHNIIKKYRFQVIKAQRIARNFFATHHCQLYLIKLQWIKYEAEFLNQLKEDGSESLSKSRRMSISKKKRDEKKDQKDVSSFPETLRDKLLKEALIEKRKLFTKARLEYAKNLELHIAQIKRKTLSEQAAVPPPVRPVAQILLTQVQLKSLMKKAFDAIQNDYF